MDTTAPPLRVAVVGRGRMGTALTGALRRAGWDVTGPLGRGADGRGGDVVLLCVPDEEIAHAARAVAPGPILGHVSGATGLDVLTPHEALGVHPLMTITEAGGEFEDAGCSVAGSTPRALDTAHRLARSLGMRAVEIADADRAAYHAAAAIASNFLVTLEDAAERLGATTGLTRDQLAPLVRAAVETWVAEGGERALTGPIARGDETTVARQREAIEERTPELLELFDALADATRALAARRGARQPAGAGSR
jgi:predicted short-subunit dehydrogenase-like oxidoreductase (DUF2520 family)